LAVAFAGSGVISGCCHEADVPLALRGLYSADPREKNKSLQTLAQCPQQSKPSVQRIASLMYDPNVGVASSAAYALRKIDSKEAREALEAAEVSRKRKRG
jgi:HEAT repeat protein